MWRRGAGLTLALVLCAPVGASAQGPSSVLTYRGDPARHGAMPGPGPVGIPYVAWEYHAHGRIESSPTLLDEVVHVVSDDGVLHALDIGSGDERFTSELHGQGGTTPLVLDGLLIVGDTWWPVDGCDRDRWGGGVDDCP